MPGWWAARPAPPGRQGRGRPRRSFERIIAAAADLVDEIGAEGFTMRLLAERLETSTATLYRHVSSKQELMVYVVDRLFAEYSPPGRAEGEPPQSWHEAAEAAAVEFNRVLSRHPNMLPLLISQVPVGPHGLQVREQTLDALVSRGLPLPIAARAYTAIAHYVIGFALQLYAPGAPGSEEAAALGDYYRRLDPGAFPLTLAAAADLTTVSIDDEFLEGLRFILDGVGQANRS
jgi:AcrR family transcriptional regulator